MPDNPEAVPPAADNAAARTVTAAALVADSQRNDTGQPPSDAKTVAPADLVSDPPASGAMPPGFFQPPGNMTPPANPNAATGELRWPSSTSGDGDCQCQRCKTAGKNQDKRGRHHAKCPCPACQKYRGLVPLSAAGPSVAPAATPAATGDEASFSDLPGMSGQPTAPGAAAPAMPDVNYEVMAKMYFDMTTGSLQMIFGPEWQPENQAERENVCAALKAYLAAKGVQDVSPGWLLAFVVVAYSAPRLRKPATSSKLRTLGEWCKDKVLYPIFRFFKRRRHYSAPQLLEDQTNNPSKTDKP